MVPHTERHRVTDGQFLRLHAKRAIKSSATVTRFLHRAAERAKHLLLSLVVIQLQDDGLSS